MSKSTTNFNVPCNNCKTGIDTRKPVYSCSRCLAGTSPKVTDLLCDKCREKHRVAHGKELRVAA